MKIALAVNRVTANINRNLGEILALVDEAAGNGATLVSFPEAALTGLINNDDPAHDLPLGVEIPGALTQQLVSRSQNKSIWIAIGLLEKQTAGFTTRLS
jgi:predicted amidohydrolase